MNAEDYLYKAHDLGIRDDVFEEARKLRIKHPHMEFDTIYETAFNTVKNNK
jgi:hypothetical protein